MVTGLISLTGNNSEGNEANQARWLAIWISEAVDLGKVSPHGNRTHRIIPQYSWPGITRIAPVEQRRERGAPRAAGDTVSRWAGIDVRVWHARECKDEWCTGPSALWFIPTFIRVLFTHLLPRRDATKSLSPSLSGSCEHTYTNNNPASNHAHLCKLSSWNEMKSQWAAECKSIFEQLKISIFVLVHEIHQRPLWSKGNQVRDRDDLPKSLIICVRGLLIS